MDKTKHTDILLHSILTIFHLIVVYFFPSFKDDKPTLTKEKAGSANGDKKQDR